MALNTKRCLFCTAPAEVEESTIVARQQADNLAEKIYYATQLDFTWMKQVLPCTVCQICLQELNIAYKFKDKCLSVLEPKCSNLKSLGKKIDHEIQEIKHEDKFDSNVFDTCSVENHSTNASINNEIETTCKALQDSTIDVKNHENTSGVKYEDSTTLNNFECRSCHKILKTSISLKRHIERLHANKDFHVPKGKTLLYSCDKCEYSTKHRGTFINHQNRHTGIKPYKCQCGKSFIQYASLSSHRRSHSLELCFTCDICNKQYRHHSNLHRHKLAEHGKVRFLCKICNKSLKSIESLKTHLNRHENIRNYNCEECGNTFISLPELINHRKKHSINSERKLECHHCGFKSNKKSVLVVHLKRHLGVKPFMCTICEISFYSKSEIKVHSRVHTKEKPYECSVCYQHFAHNNSMNRHKRKAHGIILQKVEYSI